MNQQLPTTLVTVPVLVAKCLKCGVFTIRPTRPFLSRGWVETKGVVPGNEGGVE